MSQFDSIRFQPSRPLLKEVSADRLNAIVAEIKKNRPRGERGITVRQSGDATYIGLAANIGGGTAKDIDHPFKVVVRQFQPNGPFYWGVISNSKLFFNLSPLDQGNNIVGLLGSEQSEEDAGWLEIATPDYIYLEYDVQTQTAKIDSVGNGGNFDPEANVNEEGAYIEVDTNEVPNEFKFARKIIASAKQPDNNAGQPIIEQGIKQHQLYQDIVLDGFPVAYFFDYSAGSAIQPQ